MKPISLIHRLKALGKSLLLGSAMLLPLAQQATAQTFTNGNVGEGDGSAAPMPSVDAGLDGNFYTAWKDGSQTTTGNAAYIRLNRWNPSTSTWDVLTPIAFSSVPDFLQGYGTQDSFPIRVDASGGIHLAFVFPVALPSYNALFYAYKANDATAWAITRVESYTNLNPTFANLELDSQQRPQIFTLEADPSPTGFANDVCLIRHYSKNGGSWGGSTIYQQLGGPGTGANTINTFAVAMDTADKVHVAMCSELNNSGSDAGLLYLTNISGTYATEVLAAGATGAPSAVGVCIDTDSNNQVHIIRCDPGYNLYHHRGTFGNFTSSQINGNLQGVINGNYRHVRMLTINANNDLFFAFNSSTSATNTGVLRYARLPGGTGTTWSVGDVMATGVSQYTGNFLTAATKASGEAMVVFDHYTNTAAGAPTNSPNRPRLVQYATAQFAVPPPNLSINDVTQNEGNSGTTNFTFTVSLSSAAPAGGVSFNYATVNGTATAGSDYVAASGTGTIAAGQTSTTITVTVNGDTAIESNETFAVNISNVTGANVTDAQGIGTITNDDFDTTAPETTLTAYPTARTNDNTPTFTFIGTDNVAVTSFEVRMGTSGGWTTATSPYTSTALTDGSYTFQVRAKDAANNVDATPDSVTFTVDTARPTVTLTSTAPAAVSAPFNFTINFNEDVTAGTMGMFLVTGGSITNVTQIDGDTWTGQCSPNNPGGTVSITLPQNSISDLAGNGNTVSNTLTRNVLPNAPVVTAPANGSFTNAVTPTYTGTAGANLTITVYVDGSSIGTTSSGVSGNWSFAQPSALAQGSHTVKATATSVSNSTTSGDSNTNTFTVDTTAPSAPVAVTPANGSTTGDNTPIYSGTAEAGSTVTVYVDGTSIGTPTATSGIWTFTPVTPLADGPHTVRATATDAAGNTSGNSNTNTFTVDTTPPSAPVATTPANGSRTGDNTPTLSGTAEANSTVSVIVDGSPIGTVTATNGNWTYTPGAPLADGSHTVRATAADSVGNTSPTSNTNTFTVDTTPPPAPVVISPDGDRIADNTPLITGSSEPNATITVYIDGASSGTATATAGGAWSYTVPTALAEEAYTVKATATDAVGNVSPDSATNTFYVDTTPPVAPVIAAPADGSRTNNNMPTLHGTTEPYGTAYITLTGPTPLSTNVATGQLGTWIYAIPAARADGEYTLSVYARDQVGNTGPAAETITFTVDTTAPTVALSTTAPNPAPLSGFTVTAQFSEAVTDFSEMDLVVTNANVSDFTIVDADTYTFFLTPTSPGVTVSVNIASSAANDLAGNASTAATQFTKTVIDRAVSIAVALGPVTEGTGSGSTNYPFTVTRTGGTVGPVNVTYAVTGSGAEPANAADFVGGTLPTGIVTIPDGQASASFTLNIARDLIVEPTETFTVTLSSPDNGYVLDTASGIGTIANDDTATLTVETLNNGAEYPKVDGKFRVNLSAPSSNPTTVALTFGGNATAGTDYTAPASTATIAAGETSVEVPIAVITDQRVEGTESVSIQLATINSGLSGITIGATSNASLNITDNVPAAIVINAGNSQSTVVGTAFTTPLSVRVNDAQGNPLENATVTFTPPQNGQLATGGFASIPFPGIASVATNASGIATAPTLTAGQASGPFTVTAAVSGVATPANFSLTNTPAAANRYTVAIPATAIAGTPVTATVTVLDEYGNTATGYTGTVHLTSSDTAATLGANATLTNGTGTFSVTFATGGNQTVTATDTVSSAITGTSNTSTVSPRADLAVTLTDSPDPVQAGENVTYMLTVTNNGPSAAEGVTFSLPLPEGVTFVSATRIVSVAGRVTRDWVPGWGDGYITAINKPDVGTNGTFSVEASKIETYEQFEIVGKVGYVGNGTVLSATATATTTTTDPNAANNSASVTTTVSAAPEIALHNGASMIDAPITDGQATAINFGTTTVNNPVIRSFTIANTGNDILSLTNIAVPTGFSLVNPFSPPLQGFIFPGNSYTFQVRYDAATIGTASGDLVIANNDADEAPFNFPITATRENVAPVAVTQDLTIEEDEVKEIVLTGNDADSQPITFSIVDQPQHGALTGTAPNVTYTPNADYYGDDVFTFKVNDGTADSTEVEINLTITPVNDAPKVVGTGIPDQIQIRPDVPRTIDLSTYFSDAETASASLTYEVSVIGDPGIPGPGPSVSPAVQISGSGSSLTINGRLSGVFEIKVTAKDPDELSISDTFTLTVKRVPQLAGAGVPPTLVSPSEPSFDLDLAGYFTDGDGDSLGYTITNNTDEGVLTATISGSTVTITPVTPGVASLTIRVTDSDGNFIDHTFEVTIDDPIPDSVPTVTSPPKLNRQTGLWEISLTATNNNQFNVPGFRFRVTSVMPSHIRLYNSTAPIGSGESYLDVLNVLTPGQSITIVLEFHSTTRNFAGFDPTIIAEPLPEGTSNVGDGVGMEINRFVNLADGSKLIEFSSIAGRWYEIQYSSDLITWKRSLVPVQAGANFTQWIDRGAPYTESHPSTVPSRFYRVSEILPD